MTWLLRAFFSFSFFSLSNLNQFLVGVGNLLAIWEGEIGKEKCFVCNCTTSKLLPNSSIHYIMLKNIALLPSILKIIWKLSENDSNKESMFFFMSCKKWHEYLEGKNHIFQIAPKSGDLKKQKYFLFGALGTVTSTPQMYSLHYISSLSVFTRTESYSYPTLLSCVSLMWRRWIQA